MDRANLSNDRVAVGSAALEFNKVMANTDPGERRNLASPTDPVFEAIPGPSASRGNPALNIPPQGLSVPVISESPELDIGGAVPVPVAPVEAVSAPVSRIFFTGTLGVGKDYVAAQIGAKVYGFSDPMYALAKFFFGFEVNANEGKDGPGMRKFLQMAGQYGRGTLDVNYPVSIERAAFINAVRSNADSLKALCPYLDWREYGTTDNFWANGLLSRIADSTDPLIANTNVRFDNEFKMLSDAGFQPWHVCCSSATLAERLVKKKLTMQSPELSDVSEALAKRLNEQLRKEISFNRGGGKMRVVWNDPSPCPSPRLWTLPDFCAMIANQNSNLSIA